MSTHAPVNYSEVCASVSHGFVFHSRPLGIRGAHVAVCGDPRYYLTGHLDDFAHKIIASYDRLHADYMAHGRAAALRADDVTYFVMRDGNALAYVTRNGALAVNPATPRGLRRYSDALERMTPALLQYGDQRDARLAAVGYLED